LQPINWPAFGAYGLPVAECDAWRVPRHGADLYTFTHTTFLLLVMMSVQFWRWTASPKVTMSVLSEVSLIKIVQAIHEIWGSQDLT